MASTHAPNTTAAAPPIDLRDGVAGMTVVHVIARLPASGTERQMAGMLRAMQHVAPADRHVLVVLYPGWPLAEQLAADGVEVVQLAGGPAWDARRLVQLRRLLDEVRPDVVHTSLWGASLVGRVVAGLGRDRPAIVMSERRVEDFRRTWQRAVDRRVARLTDAWIGNSPAVTDFVQRAHGVGAERVHLVGNGIDTAVFHPMPAPPDDRRRPLVGSVGRLVDQKGFDLLVEAVAIVRRHHDVGLTIAGDGPLRDDLARHADRLGVPLRLRGFLEQPADVAGLLAELDVFVMSSRYEGLPNTLLEAQACGIPAVATDAPGIAPACGPAVALVAAGDPASLATGIRAQLPLGRVPVPPLRTFDAVAVEHRAVFRKAVAARATA